MKKTLRRGLLTLGIVIALPVLGILGLMILGGNLFQSSHSYVYCQCPKGAAKTYTVELTKVTDRLMLVHDGGLGWVIESYSIRIPRIPDRRTVFDATELSLQTGPGKYQWLTKYGHQFVSGDIVVDTTDHTIAVSLMTPDGPFAGNGKYPFKWWGVYPEGPVSERI